MGDEAEDYDDAPLAGWARWLMGIGGTALCVVGTVAVFVPNTNVAGVPLLIVVGAGFMYAALAGQRLLQVNKDGFTFARLRRLQRGAQAVANDPEIPQEVRERIVDVFEDNGVPLTPATSAQVLEDAVEAAFRSLGREFNFDVVREKGPRDAGVDLVIKNQHDMTLGVEVKTHLRTRGWAEAIRQLRRAKMTHRILIVDGGLPPELSQPFEAENIWTIGWGPGGREDLVALIRRIGFIS